jgi:hypothetical protein
MKKNKELNATISLLEGLIAGSDVDPEQKKHVGDALDELRWLRRKPEFTQEDVSYCVRKVAVGLLSAFRKD